MIVLIEKEYKQGMMLYVDYNAQIVEKIYLK